MHRRGLGAGAGNDCMLRKRGATAVQRLRFSVSNYNCRLRALCQRPVCCPSAVAQSTALTISSMTFLASPKTIMVFSR